MSIEGHEDQTHELTPYEIEQILPRIVDRMKTKIGKKMKVTNAHVVKMFKKHGFKLSEPRFRKIVQHIRVTGLIKGLVSHGNGYFVATKRSEIQRNIRSLDQRINSIISTRDALHFQMKQMFDQVDEFPFNTKSE